MSGARPFFDRLEARLGRAPTATAFLLALLAAAFLPVVLGDRSFFSYDLLYEHLPVWHSVQRALRGGDSPFWLDGIFMGHPFLFHQEAPLFYPLAAPLLLTGAPVHRLADVFSLLHIALAGSTAYLLVRALTRSAPAALFGGIAWMLSARTVQGVTWPNAVAVTAWVPLLLLALLKLSRGERRGGLILGSFSGGLVLLLSRPQSLLGALPAILAVALAGAVLSRSRGRYLGDLATTALLALLLGAPAVVPSALVLPETTRTGGLSPVERNDGALTGADLDQLVLPVDGLGRWPEAATYPGVAALGFFLLAFGLLRREGDREARIVLVALSVGGLVGLVFAFGESGPYRFVSGLPLLSGFRSPARFLAATAAALAFGSALGLAALARRSGRGRILAWVAVAFLAIDLGVHAYHAAPTVPPDAFLAEPRLASHLRSLPPDALGIPRRYWSLGLLTPVHELSEERLVPVLATADHLNNARGMRFGLEAVQGAGPALRRTDQLLSTRSLRVAELGGAARIVVRGPPGGDEVDAAAPPLPQAHLLSVRDPLPRALLVPRSLVLPPETALPMLLDPAFDPRETVLLEEGPTWPASAECAPSGSVRLLGRRPGRLSLETESACPAVLLVLQAWEAGWEVAVDDRDASVLRANVAFQAVLIEAGRHRVDLVYCPRGLRDGFLLGLAGVLGVVVAARRRPPSSSGEARDGEERSAS
ncbi:MAG: YfhO family protein [Thermoanaerobaculia bacterium]